jgi:hypothetical protein
MDKSTRATLWIAFIIIASYVVWFFTSCAMDDACRFVCTYARSGCHTEWTTPKQD